MIATIDVMADFTPKGATPEEQARELEAFKLRFARFVTKEDIHCPVCGREVTAVLRASLESVKASPCGCKLYRGARIPRAWLQQ